MAEQKTIADDPRCPNFFILGAAKSGTTTLYDVLRQHPDVFLTEVKEPQFFSNDTLYARGIDHYLSHHFGGSERFAARGEATPHYLCFEKVAQRISRWIPGNTCRFIVVMRDPAKRAWSLYWNMVSEGVEPLEFEAALAQERERRSDPQIDADGSLRYAYVSSGDYARQIKAYLKYFDISQFHFVWFEDLVANPSDTIATVCRFLGVRSDTQLDFDTKSNSSHRPRSAWLHNFIRSPNPIKSLFKPLVPERLRYRLTTHLTAKNRAAVRNPALDARTEMILREQFDDDLAALERLTGRDLAAWRAPHEEAVS